MAKAKKTKRLKKRRTVKKRPLKKRAVKKVAVKRRAAKRRPAKKHVRKNKAKPTRKRSARKGRVGLDRGMGNCVCREKNGLFFCMIRTPSGRLKSCPTQPPFATLEECQKANC